MTSSCAAGSGHAVDNDIHVEFSGVTQEFLASSGRVLVMEGVNLTVFRGEVVCIVGPSGCGKSTLLNMVAGLVIPTDGRVYYDGQEVRSINTSVGYMTQHDTLLPWRTVAKNVGLPLEIARMRRSERIKRVDEVLKLVGLDRQSQYPSQLSGGMLKRAALAQVLIYEPTTLLMDEPFGALDAQLRLVLQREFLDIQSRTHQTVLFVTHDLEEAILLADRIVVLGSGPGRIVHIEDVPFGRKRDLLRLRNEPEFPAIWERLWGLLAPELAESKGAR